MLTRTINLTRIFIAMLTFLLCAQAANAQSTSFTYQGRLTSAGNPANVPHDMQFKLYDTVDVGTGTQHGTTVTNAIVQVSNGIFMVDLDFGACASCFDGTARFLEISVRPAGSAVAYTVLSPRQPVTSTPYSVRSLNSTAADGLSVACVNCVTSTQIQSVEGTQITGAIPVESVPTGSGNYIQNAAAPLRPDGKNGMQQKASFNIEGDGTIGGTLSANLVNSTTQYNIGGNSVLSVGAGLDNLFAGLSAGESNTTGSQNGFFGRSAGIGNTTGFDNSSFGAFSGGQANMTGSANSFFGVSAGFNTSTGSANMFFGRSAGFQNTTGMDNSFFGAQAGRDSTTGSQNSFFGRASGIGNTTGFDNSYFGAFTAQAVSTGSANSFFGVSAGFNNTGSANAFFGRSAGFQNTLGNSNSFFGTQAGRDNLVGISNSFFGRSAGIDNVNGSANTIIGANANVGASSLTNATAIGANAVVSQSNSLVLGNNANVGIGTSSPVTRLAIEGGPVWTSNFWTASLSMLNSSAIGWEANPFGQRFGIGQSIGGLYFFRTISGFGSTLTPAVHDVVLTNNGDLAQPVERHGLVKAMAYITYDGGIIPTLRRCYNGITNTSSGDCGFIYGAVSVGIGTPGTRITFGFTVSDRFVVITGIQGIQGSVWAFPDAQTVDVEGARNGFYLIIY